MFKECSNERLVQYLPGKAGVSGGRLPCGGFPLASYSSQAIFRNGQPGMAGVLVQAEVAACREQTQRSIRSQSVRGLLSIAATRAQGALHNAGLAA